MWRRGFTGVEIAIMGLVIAGLAAATTLVQQSQNLNRKAACSPAGKQCVGGWAHWCYDNGKLERGDHCCTDVDAGWNTCPGTTSCADKCSTPNQLVCNNGHADWCNAGGCWERGSKPCGTSTCLPFDPTAGVCQNKDVYVTSGQACQGFAGTCLKNGESNGFALCGCVAPTLAPTPKPSCAAPDVCIDNSLCVGSASKQTGYSCAATSSVCCRFPTAPTPTRTPTPTPIPQLPYCVAFPEPASVDLDLSNVVLKSFKFTKLAGSTVSAFSDNYRVAYVTLGQYASCGLQNFGGMTYPAECGQGVALSGSVGTANITFDVTGKCIQPKAPSQMVVNVKETGLIATKTPTPTPTPTRRPTPTPTLVPIELKVIYWNPFSRVGAREIEMSWTSEKAINSYDLYRCQGSACIPGTRITTVTANSTGGGRYRDTAVTPNTTYTYQVKSQTPLGTAVSNLAWTTTLPLTPIISSAVAGCPARVDLSWGSVPGATKYEIQRSYNFSGIAGGCAEFRKIAETAGSQYADTLNNGNYELCYEVRAFNASTGRYSDYSPTAQPSVRCAAPTPTPIRLPTPTPRVCSITALPTSLSLKPGQVASLQVRARNMVGSGVTAYIQNKSVVRITEAAWRCWGGCDKTLTVSGVGVGQTNIELVATGCQALVPVVVSTATPWWRWPGR